MYELFNQMALLASCWFIIESILIPNGYTKWFCLSYYIHPLLLVLCQICLWIKLLRRWLILTASLPFRTTCFLLSSIFSFFTRSFSLFLHSFVKKRPASNDDETRPFKDQNQIVPSHYCCRKNISESVQLREIQSNWQLRIKYLDRTDCENDSAVDEPAVESVDEDEEPSANDDDGDVSSPENLSPERSSTASDEDEGVVAQTMPLSSIDSVMEQELAVDQESKEEPNSFYNKYTERMKWFDALNRDRTYGICAILNKELDQPISFDETIEPLECSLPYGSWIQKMGGKRLVRSLESDFELVYVAQSCLSWEALHHQYQNLEEALAFSSDNTTNNSLVFSCDAAAKFQRFRILLERFLEDNRCQFGKRYWNYVQRRSAFKSLLQVPQVSAGNIEEEENGRGTRREGMKGKEVLKAIEKCIKTYWLFVKENNRKPWWRFRMVSWTYPRVEDPRDLELLADITRTFQKKELQLKEIQGKNRCWLKRIIVANPAGQVEPQKKKQVLFAMIDMKLVERVLNLSVISTCQLIWCQEKLCNIVIAKGNIQRPNPGPLFPSS